MDLVQLTVAIAAVAPIGGVAVVSAIIPSWHIVARPDGLLIRIDYRDTATPVQIANGDAVAVGWDFSLPAEASRENLAQREQAKVLVADGDGSRKLLRVFIDLVLDGLNAIQQQVIGTTTQAWDPASIANGTGATSPAFAVAGASFGDAVDVSAPYSLGGLTATGSVQAAGQVVVRLENQTGGAVNLASGTWRAVVRRPRPLPDRTLTAFKAAVAARLDTGVGD
mgnify:CR=1 FL=1